MNRHYSPDAYDNHGVLRLPFSFWLVTLLLARAWVLLIIAGVSRQQGATLLALFYPHPLFLALSLVTGIPAVLAGLLTGYRQRWPRLWQRWRAVLCLSLLLSIGLQGWLTGQDDTDLLLWRVLWAWFCLLACGYLLFNPRLKDCFDPTLNGAG